MQETSYLPLSERSVQDRIVLACSLSVLAISTLVLVGIFLNVPTISSVFPVFPEMKPNTALSFLFAGIGFLCISKFTSSNKLRLLRFTCGLIILLIGVLTSIEYLAGINIGIDTFFLQDAGGAGTGSYPGRMSPHSAVSFAALGLSICMLGGRRLFWKISEFFAALVVTLTFASILGQLYGAEKFYGITPNNGMAALTAMLFVACSIGLFAANRESQTIKLLTSKSLGGATARKLLPAVILIPTGVGWLRIIGQKMDLYDTGVGAALTIFVCVVSMCAIVLFLSTNIHKADTRQKQFEAELAEKEQRYRDLFDYGQSMICIHDLNGILLTVNPAALKSLGFEYDQLIGHNIRDFMPTELQHYFAGFLRQIEHQGLAEGTFELVANDGKRVVWKYQCVLVSEAGKEPYVLGNAQDITKLIDAKNQLKNLSLKDELTGLYNRRGFLTMADQQFKLERHDGTARGLTLMFADMDGLKKINDVYGHEAGSEAIRSLANIMRSALRESDLVARWGGDEFVILTIGSHNKHADLVSERINDMIDEFNETGDKPYQLACSIGLAPVPIVGNRSIENILADADKAMYEEKNRRKAGRDAEPNLYLPVGNDKPLTDIGHSV